MPYVKIVRKTISAILLGLRIEIDTNYSNRNETKYIVSISFIISTEPVVPIIHAISKIYGKQHIKLYSISLINIYRILSLIVYNSSSNKL